MSLKNLGGQVKTVWNDLRPMTKKMLEKALGARLSKPTFSYDAHADWELSSLLDALDEEVRVKKSIKNDDRQLADLAEICASVLESQTESAEVFIQLMKRALARNDFVKVDELGAALFDRFAAAETAEVIRQTKMPQIRAIGFETLAALPVPLITPLLEDPLYFDIACNVLEQQAIEFESEDARRVLEQLDFTDDGIWQ
jgi:hypothetical protein